MQVSYLGHIIIREGTSPGSSKVEAVQQFPTPKNVKNLIGFLGSAGYSRKCINSCEDSKTNQLFV